MEKKYILAIDQGTTSSRAIIFDKKGNKIAVAQKEFPQYFPKSGWVEHDANEIWQSVQSVLADLFIHSGAQPSEIAAIGITNQRETTVVWNKNTGLPISHALVWQSRQSADICDQLIADGYENFFHKKTGLVIDAYFSATKIRWILDNVPTAQEMAEAGDLLFGTIDTWLLWKLTNGESFATDVTNASRTMLYNIVEEKWDEEILHLLNIPVSMLPEVRKNSEIYGYTKDFHFFGESVPIANLMGDQQAALVGQQCFEEGMIKNTYGTGAFIIMNTGENPHFSENKLLTTIAYKLDDKVTYALEGSIFIAGSVVQWLRDGVKILTHADQSEEMAYKSDTDDDIYLVPAFTGLGAPYWNQNARGAIFGLTRATNDNDLVKAALQAICYQTKDILDTMTNDTGISIPSLRVDGGATANSYLMQFQADVLNVPIRRPENAETTAFGTALLAGLAIGFWKNKTEVERMDGKLYQPNMDKERREKLYQGWVRAVTATQTFSK
ncbi:glycerol kinase GlpK [Lactovum miscens]|uniref:Glycerol kinase n=1 Tax=Lactovum miscens TaxID=190387 RepID=A0A841C6W4_9LACT|nr:glycerol kinase GlpK [Lactovum miscens]MBB5888027.1 glycerol kinase [Lactovum miscens]